MTFLDKYRIPMMQNPEAGAGGGSGTPPPPVVDPAAATDPPKAEPPAEPATPAAKPKLPDAVISEITSLRGKNREKDAQIERLQREAADAKALAERLQAGNKDPVSPPPAQRQTPPATPGEDEVDRRAEYKLFVRDVQAMQQHGIKEYGAAWTDAVRVLEAIGANDDRFVAEVIAVDGAGAHKLLNAIAQDAEQAVALMRMAPAQRIAELTRMSMTLAAPKAAADPEKKPADPPAAAAGGKKNVSAAPPPPPAVEPGSVKVKDWRSDEATDQEFSDGWEKRQAERRANRR